MRVHVNLATRPFVELRPFFLRLRLLMLALAIVGAGIAVWAHFMGAKATAEQVDMDRLRNLTIATQRAKLQTEQHLRQPANAAVLDRANFLNTLFLRKSFSWTAVMMDLEDVLPVGVQVTSIEPAVTANGAVTIRLRVAGERDRAVQLVRNLERSQRFLQPRLGSESAQSKENAGGGQRTQPAPGGPPLPPPGVEFEILAVYNPLPPGQAFRAGHGRTFSAVVRPASLATDSTGTAESTPGPVHATVAASSPVGTTAPAVPQAIAPGSSGNPAANPSVRRPYPRDGVVLPPYGRPPRFQDGHLPAQPPTEGGPL